MRKSPGENLASAENCESFSHSCIKPWENVGFFIKIGGMHIFSDITLATQGGRKTEISVCKLISSQVSNGQLPYFISNSMLFLIGEKTWGMWGGAWFNYDDTRQFQMRELGEHKREELVNSLYSDDELMRIFIIPEF